MLNHVQAGFITDTQATTAKRSPLNLKPATPKYFLSIAPYFTNWVAQELPKVLSMDQLEVGGLNIRTSINLAWQKEGQQVIRKNAPGTLQSTRAGTGNRTGASSRRRKISMPVSSTGHPMLAAWINIRIPAHGGRVGWAETRRPIQQSTALLSSRKFLHRGQGGQLLNDQRSCDVDECLCSGCRRKDRL